MGISARTLLRSRWTLSLLGVIGVYLGSLIALRHSAVLDRKVVPAAMHEAAGYLVRHMDGPGRFAYSVHLQSQARPEDYNVLRHAQALHTLAAYHDLTADPAARETLLRGSAYLIKRHVRPVANHPGLQAVYSWPGEEIKGTNALIKLGGCGLGIGVLVKSRQLEPASVPLSLLREMGQFVLFMQESNGRFRSTYDDQTQTFGSFESLFYPGEAIVGLAFLHRVDPDPRWLEAAWRGLTYLAEQRRDWPVWRLPPDHWFLMAAAEVMNLDGPSPPPEVRQRWMAHARAIGQKLLREQWVTSWVPGWNGSFVLRGAVAASAARMEGLAALGSVLPADDPERAAAGRALASGLAFMLRGRMTEGDLRGGFTGALRWPISYHTALADEIRVDYVGHALGALVGWQSVWGTPNSALSRTSGRHADGVKQQ